MSDEKPQSGEVLTVKQKKYLKGLAHPLTPAVKIGKEGMAKGVLGSIRMELNHHELIKVKIGSNSSVDKLQAAQLIPDETESSLVQLIGKTLILYKENPKKPKEKRIRLPKS